MYLNFVRENGSLVNTITLKIFNENGNKNIDYFPFYVSPNGRYVAYAVNPHYMPESTVEQEDLDPNMLRMNIYEIIKGANDIFELKLEKTIERFNEMMKLDEGVKTFYVDRYDNETINMTDNLDFYKIRHCGDRQILYNRTNMMPIIKHRLGRDDTTKKLREISEFKWIAKNGGLLGFTSEVVFFVKISEKGQASGPMRIKIKMNKDVNQILEVLRSPAKNLIVIVIKEKAGHTNLFLVWDVYLNQEVSNYSGPTSYTFVLGKNTKAGYLLNRDTYLNLAHCLPNYFFDYNFPEKNYNSYRKVLRCCSGYRINETEDMVIDHENMIRKETLLKVVLMGELLSQDRDTLNDLNEENINIDKLRFSVDGSTVFHFFAMNTRVLALVLDLFEEKMPKYLTSIVMKNNKGYSPIDITILNVSPKNSELLLKKLSLFKDMSLSRLFYD